MKRSPLTVMVHEGVIARAYLARLRRAGIVPEHIVLLVGSNHPSSGKPMGRWLPQVLRRAYAQKVQEVALNFWPRQIKKIHPQLFHSITRSVSDTFQFDYDVYDEILGSFDYGQYAESVQSILIQGLKDPKLATVLAGLEYKTILFTGGGLVPSSLLSLDDLRFIHIHPGFLPYVRGADGLLWSTLVRGRPGASGFYMAPGIDTGKVIQAEEFAPVVVPLNGITRPDDQTLYRAVFSYIDPFLRSEMLLKILESGTDPANLPCQAQDESAGVTYHFLHSAVRKRALQILFPD